MIPILIRTTALLVVLYALPVSAENTLSRELQTRITDYLKATEVKYGMAAQSLAVLRNGELVFTQARGLANIELGVAATTDTVFTLYSVAKLFVNVTVMQLVEAGDVDLDEPISTYVPDLPDSWQTLTVRQLLAHTSGLPEFYRWPNPTPESAAAALASVRDLPFEFEPGTANRYNQTNFLLLRLLIEHVTGTDFEAYVKRQMIESAELENTRYGGEFAVVPRRATAYRATPTGIQRNVFIDQPDYFFASSGLNSNAPDLATWFQALLAGQLITKDTLEAMWRPYRRADGAGSSFTNGWEYRETDELTVVGHGGGNRVGVYHYVRKDGESVTVIYLGNGSARDYWPAGISGEIAAMLFASID